MNPKTNTNIIFFAIIAVCLNGGSHYRRLQAQNTPSTIVSENESFIEGKLPEFLTSGKANVNSLLRYEYADIDSFGGGPDPKESNALTLRTRLGYTTGILAGFKGMLEFENVTSINGEDQYNPAGLNPESRDRSVIADPEATEVNRVWLAYDNWDTQFKFGRQRIVLDGARFIGNVVWRQNEQTFDAFSIRNNKLLPNTKLFYAHLFGIHRILGDDHPSGNWESDSHIFNASWKINNALNLTGYGYLLDLEDSPRVSSSTYGLSLDGKHSFNEDWSGNFKAEYATQSDYGDNPVDYTAPYIHTILGAAYKKVNFGVGYEMLASDDGEIGFSTPLATAHKFNGWADAWLSTPANGLDDKYVWVGYKFPKEIPVKIIYHDFSSEDGNQDYGEEINMIATKKLGKYFSLLAKGAIYQDGDAGRAGRTRYWLQVGFDF